VFFQAEDGIRDFHVTGVQTCALPISVEALFPFPPPVDWDPGLLRLLSSLVFLSTVGCREEFSQNGHKVPMSHKQWLPLTVRDVLRRGLHWALHGLRHVVGDNLPL